MSADAIVYCLEHLTDYQQFERLCSDIMNQAGFSDIEPLGGSSDRGRDALHVTRSEPNDVTIFAYSVRADWQHKLLKEDCKRIRSENHRLNRLVFACTSSISTTERDAVVDRVRDDFGWQLELFDLERLRVRLAGDLRYLIAQHPAIFCPPFFPSRGGLSIADSRDTLVIDHIASDHALATWLARRLQLAGYRTWCLGTAPLAGETADATVRILIERRATRYFPVLSAASVGDPDFVGRCSTAAGIDDLVIPCTAGEFNTAVLPSKIRLLTPVNFNPGFGSALATLLATLSAQGLHPVIDAARGKAIALRSYVPQPVTKPEPETVYANTFSTEVPTALHAFQLEQELSDADELELRRLWAFCRSSPTLFLSFTQPPTPQLRAFCRRLETYAWGDIELRYGKRSINVVKELIRRSLDVACARAKLEWCSNRRVYYFSDEGKVQKNVSYTHVDGRKTRVAVTGEHTLGFGERASPFRYQLSPHFSPGQDTEGNWWVTLRIYVRVTDRNGTPYEKKAVTRRRKNVANNWWNKEWFARVLGVIQTIGEGQAEIAIGSGSEALRVRTGPLSWQCPISIDYHAVEAAGDFQEEIAGLRYVEEDDLDDVDFEGGESVANK